MSAEPIIAAAGTERPRMAADGESFAVHQWRGSGPTQLHVHHDDDEAWHVLEGTLRFRFQDRTVDLPAGSTVFVPSGVAHTYAALGEADYLVILTPRLRRLIAELQTAEGSAHPEIYRRHGSELLE